VAVSVASWIEPSALLDGDAWRSAVALGGRSPGLQRSRRPLSAAIGGLHGDLDAAVAGPGPFRQAQSLVERSSAAVDREHVENQVLARAFGLVRKRADDPGTDARP
jgi:hypothetical protein